MGRRLLTAALLLAHGVASAAAEPEGDEPRPPARPTSGGPVDPKTDWEAQYTVLLKQLAQERPWFDRIGAQAYHPQALILAEDRDPLDVVLRRTAALLADIRATGARRDWTAQATALAELHNEGRQHVPDAPAAPAAVLPKSGRRPAPGRRPAAPPLKHSGPRYELYLKACELRRQIAFANPLLDFGEILFVQRHLSANHLCDQFYGHLAKKGGGLFVLSEAFGPRPTLRNVLANSVVERGRLAGRPLTPGAFLSPDLSFDGKAILFAYTELVGGGHWTQDTAWHVFRVNPDGTGLTQLTDGTWDDFDPCFLPDGQIAFVSERRGGYLRCSGGRPCPVYTLFAMGPDGSAIRNLSFHETHEWQPSVDNDGRLVYTRWDYVDRDTSAAHHIWSCYPDGRDPRSAHGNYPLRRQARPWFEADIRAIPESTGRYVATAAGHHWQAFGSLVLLDQALEDDGAMGQVRRLTPEAPFPEGERYNAMYATAWPLSEKYFLCAYDAAGSDHGLYLADCFGNRELLYRDPTIPSMSPMPLRPRPLPPTYPRQDDPAKPCTAAVMNVYEADFAWPPDTRIAALRIIQLLPKSTPVLNRPRIGVAGQTNARQVLGSVPVESDGSAFFEAPPGKPIYFQALDEKGLAVQSMRSVTYLHPGEQMTCQGCHEGKRAVPPGGHAVPLALRRAPSKLAPEPEGANPFNYAVLVQPALDRNCVSCHKEKGALDLSGAPGQQGFTRSYEDLARKYGFYFDSTKGCYNRGRNGGRTVAGQFGARAAELLRYLDKTHHGVNLPAEDFRRITLWLDCNSEFFGAYEDTAAQLRGELVKPTLE
jgi:hypothetical protein